MSFLRKGGEFPPSPLKVAGKGGARRRMGSVVRKGPEGWRFSGRILSILLLGVNPPLKSTENPISSSPFISPPFCYPWAPIVKGVCSGLL